MAIGIMSAMREEIASSVVELETADEAVHTGMRIYHRGRRPRPEYRRCGHFQSLRARKPADKMQTRTNPAQFAHQTHGLS